MSLKASPWHIKVTSTLQRRAAAGVRTRRTAGDCSTDRGVRPVSSPPSGGCAAERALGGDRPGTRISVL